MFTLLCSTIFWITFALVKRRAGTLIEPYDITAGQWNQSNYYKKQLLQCDTFLKIPCQRSIFSIKTRVQSNRDKVTPEEELVPVFNYHWNNFKLSSNLRYCNVVLANYNCAVNFYTFTKERLVKVIMVNISVQ